MDLTIPYTFYPVALPSWIAWVLFLTATSLAIGIGIATGRQRGWPSDLALGLAGLVLLLAATMVASMVITSFCTTSDRMSAALLG